MGGCLRLAQSDEQPWQVTNEGGTTTMRPTPPYMLPVGGIMGTTRNLCRKGVSYLKYTCSVKYVLWGTVTRACFTCTVIVTLKIKLATEGLYFAICVFFFFNKWRVYTLYTQKSWLDLDFSHVTTPMGKVRTSPSPTKQWREDQQIHGNSLNAALAGSCTKPDQTRIRETKDVVHSD